MTPKPFIEEYESHIMLLFFTFLHKLQLIKISKNIKKKKYVVILCLHEPKKYTIMLKICTFNKEKLVKI